MKHWLDLTDADRERMSEDEKQDSIRLSLENDIELIELVRAGLWVRRFDQCIYKLPLCHDFGVTP